MGTLSTIQCGGLVERLRGLYLTSLEVGLKQWLQRELAGYADLDPLPWYRIVECRQRGLFQNIRSGKQQTCQINEQTLNQRDLAEIKFLFLRGPLIAYLDCHALVLERWPEVLLQEYVPTMSREMAACNLSLRAIQHRHWQI